MNSVHSLIKQFTSSNQIAQEFNHYGDPEDFYWDVMSGVSAGAINTSAMSLWDKSDGYEMSEWLSDEW